MFIEGTYIAYLLVSVTVTIWVARTLHRRGAAFLVEAFAGNKELGRHARMCQESAREDIRFRHLRWLH